LSIVGRSVDSDVVMELLLAKVSDVRLKELVIKAKDWALLNGLALRPSDGDPGERVKKRLLTLK
jgi:hypothetical protein